MLINVRGVNGSGKSTLVRSYIEGLPEIYLGDGVIGYYNKDLDLIVVGKYRTACGGCDSIKTQALTKGAIDVALMSAGNVLFEGILISTIYGPWRDFSQERGGMVWAYLDTPVEVCLERIYVRNGGKPIKEDLVHDKVRSIERTREKAREDGETVFTLNYKDARADLDAILEAGEML